jgi:hypothetical protein
MHTLLATPHHAGAFSTHSLTPCVRHLHGGDRALRGRRWSRVAGAASDASPTNQVRVCYPGRPGGCLGLGDHRTGHLRDGRAYVGLSFALFELCGVVSRRHFDFVRGELGHRTHRGFGAERCPGWHRVRAGGPDCEKDKVKRRKQIVQMVVFFGQRGDWCPRKA